MERIGRESSRLSWRNTPLLFAAILCLCVSAALPLALNALLRNEQEAAGRVKHTLEVLNTAAAVELNVTTFTSEARGYFVNRNPRLLGLFDEAVRRVGVETAKLRALTSDNPLQQTTMDRLEPLIVTRFEALRAAIELKRASDDEDFLRAIAEAPKGRPLIEAIVDELNTIKSEERRLLEARTRDASAAAEWTLFGIGVGGTFATAAGFASVWLLVTRHRRRERMAIMQRLNADLERRFDERTRELAASEARQKAYFNHLADGLVAIRVEPEGRLIYEEANAAARDMLGYPEDLAGQTFHELWPEAVADHLIAKLLGCVRERRPVRYHTSVPTPAGPREFRSVVAPVFGPPETGFAQGRVVLLLSSVRDVTHETMLEKQLREAQRLEAVGRLSAGMAHDFNNLLQAQMGSLELLEDAIDAGDAKVARGHVATALRLGERGAVLTHHLLSFSRKQVLRPCPVDPARSLPATATMLASTLGPNIRVTVDIDPATGSAMADPNLLETALLNLAFNARDAMPQGGRLLLEAYPVTLSEAGVGASPAAGRYVVFAVSDEGSGMSPETLERALEPFFTTKAANGSGLGLAMVQGFALQSRGDMRIQSELGRGTRIEVWLPACDGSETVADIGTTPARALSGRRALVVDDVADVLVAVGAFLQAAGFDVTEADTGAAALDVLHSGQKFDLLVSDYTMPGMTGAELVARALDVAPELSVLIVTGNAEQFVAQQLPNVRVLLKPFRRDGLLLAVEEVMRSHSARQQAATASS